MATSTVTGSQASITIATKAQTVYGMSDFTLSFTRGTSEQPLVGCEGNEFFEGALTISGSYSCCKFGADQNCDSLKSVINGTVFAMTGEVAPDSVEKHLNWDFTQVQITSFDISEGNASQITEASIDFIIMNPQDTIYTRADGKVSA